MNEELKRALIMGAVCGAVAGASFIMGRREGVEKTEKNVNNMIRLSHALGFAQGYAEATGHYYDKGSEGSEG